MTCQDTDPPFPTSREEGSHLKQENDGSLIVRIRESRILRLFVLTVLIVGVSVFQFETLHASHTWGDDFAVYIIAARRIVNGIPFSDAVAYNGPRKVELGWRVAYPLVLTPFYSFFGNSCLHLKIPNVICQVLSSILLFFLIRTLTGKVWLAFLGFILFGFHPYFTFFKNTLGPDILSITTMLALTWFFIYPLKEQRYRPSLLLVLSSVVLVIHLLVRRQSWSILPVSICWFGWTCFKSYRWKGFRILLVAASTLLILCLVLAGQWFAMVKYFFVSSNFSWSSFLDHLTFYAAVFPHFFYPCSPDQLIRSLVAGTWISIAIFGLLDNLKVKGFGFLDLMLACYAIPPMFFSALQGERYILPVFVISFLYLILGLNSILVYFSESSACVLIVSISFFAIMVCPMVTYSMFAYRTLPATEYDGPYNPTVEEFFSYVKENLDPNADVLFFKPRAFKLFTKRTATGSLPSEMKSDLLTTLVNKGQITHVALLRSDEYKSEYKQEEKTRKWIHSIPNKKLIFENEWFDLYSVSRFNY